MRYSYIKFLLLLIFLSACSSKNVVGGSDELRPLAGSPNLPDCHPAIGWEEIDAAPNNNIVFFGELHGTVEGPAHVGEYLCAVASSGKSVALALEIPNSFSDGLMLGWNSDSPKAVWLDQMDGFWNAPETHQDGRKSVAMLALMARAHILHVEGLDVSIEFFSPSRKQYEDFGKPEGIAWLYEAEAENLRSLASHYDQVIVLVGNIHAMREADFLDFKTTASFLGDNSVSLNMLADGGEAWNCVSGTCIARTVKRNRDYSKIEDSQSNPMGLTDLLSPAFDGYVLLGGVNASPPAISAKESSD